MEDRAALLKKAAELLSKKTPLLPERELKSFVRPFIERRETFLNLIERHGSPLYVFDEAALEGSVQRFTAAFSERIPRFKAFYAMKSDSHPSIVRGVVAHGMGLDASSGEELAAALDAGAERIIFSGPGKLPEELQLAVEYAGKVTLMLDGFNELRRLEQVAAAAGVTARAGVRVMAQEQGLWRKFGIELKRLGEFIDAAASCPHVSLEGLQFHTSWNLTPAAQTRFIRRLGGALSKLDAAKRKGLKFVDIGGGFWPERGEWLHPSATDEGRLAAAIGGTDDFPPLVHHRLKGTPIEIFALKIAAEVERSLRPWIDPEIYAEPGRWICNDALHILIRVADVKAPDLAICDAGTNTVGWERFESDYFPLINLDRPSLTERRCRVLGSLCTPHDVWGYAYFGEDLKEGDTLLVPTQGAYTWGLRQRFIKPLPLTAILYPDSSSELLDC